MVCNAETDWRHAWLREGEILTCPWHGIEFDLITGVSLASPKLRVRRYPITVEDGQVKVSM
jgi:nitrite reductase/ring-hydroxylating ferredoxin subunit